MGRHSGEPRRVARPQRQHTLLSQAKKREGGGGIQIQQQTERGTRQRPYAQTYIYTYIHNKYIHLIYTIYRYPHLRVPS